MPGLPGRLLDAVLFLFFSFCCAQLVRRSRPSRRRPWPVNFWCLGCLQACKAPFSKPLDTAQGRLWDGGAGREA